MGLAEMHFYRFTFLKSEQWQNIRLSVLAKQDAKCARCGKRDLSNDVHHMKYPKSFRQAHKCTMIVLCRVCHDLVHELVKDAGKEGSVRRQVKALGLGEYRKKPPTTPAKPAKIKVFKPKKPAKVKVKLSREDNVQLGKIISEIKKSGCSKPVVVFTYSS